MDEEMAARSDERLWCPEGERRLWPQPGDSPPLEPLPGRPSGKGLRLAAAEGVPLRRGSAGLLVRVGPCGLCCGLLKSKAMRRSLDGDPNASCTSVQNKPSSNIQDKRN